MTEFEKCLQKYFTLSKKAAIATLAWLLKESGSFDKNKMKLTRLPPDIAPV